MGEPGFQPGNTYGTGRPPGAVNRRSEELRRRLRDRGDVDPADFLSSIVSSDKESTELKTAAANYLLPYLYSKRGAVTPPRYVEESFDIPQFTHLSDAEQFLAKLAALSPGKRLLLKNPAHSARIRQLRALFPGAKFIHIHRHPFDVFPSTQKLYSSLLPLLALQRYEHNVIDEHILWSYPELMKRLLDSLEELPSGTVTTVSYKELVAEPAATIERIYRELDIDDFGQARTLIQEAVCQPFQRPATNYDLDETARSCLASRWGPVFDRLNYSEAIAVERSNAV